MTLQERRDFLRWQRLAEQKALQLVAAVGAQELALLDRLDPFGDDFQPQTMAERDDALGDRHVVRIVGYVLDERAVDLDAVDREALQVSQRGVAGAEVVDREVDPHRLEL